MMSGQNLRRQRVLLRLASLGLLATLSPGAAQAAGYGRLAGLVFDTRGTPLMGATVLIVGPTTIATDVASETLDRVITDGRGGFSVDHLVPGWYSLKVMSPTRLPAMRNGIRVAAGETAVARFVLADTFAPVRFQVPNSSVSSWGDDWKWVLRTSSTTRPILRYQKAAEVAQDTPKKKESKHLREPDQRMVGVLPGGTRRDPLSEDPGWDSVVAYLRPLTRDSDLLVSASYGASSTEAGSMATAFRRVTPNGNSQEMGFVIHQFNLAAGQLGPDGIPHAQGMVMRYSETRLLAPHVMVTAGMDVDYLNSLAQVLNAQPHVKLEYQATGSTVLAVQYGSGRPEGSSNLSDRVGTWNSFPLITERDYRLRLERLNHTEAAVTRRIGRSARVQAAAFHDDLQNAAVWGVGQPGSTSWLSGDYLPNPLVRNGLLMNAGSYHGVGFRAIYSQNFGKRTEALVDFSSGNALAVRAGQTNWPDMVRAEQTYAAAGKFSSELPGTRTRLVTSYEWVPGDRVSLVDPYGQSALQIQPYLGLQVRQPLPTPTFLPVHIEALADFSNLLGQGYVPVNRTAGSRPVLLSSGYRCIRGGFSVQF